MPIPKHLRDSLDARLPQTKQGMPSDKDIVEEARDFAAFRNETTPMGPEGKGLLRALADEVEGLRKHVEDLNHDLEASIKECNELHQGFEAIADAHRDAQGQY